MGLFAILPTFQADEKTLQLKFGQEDNIQVEVSRITLPAEWFPQSGVQLTWPHEDTDWKPILKEVTKTYLSMAYEIASREKLILVTPDTESLKNLIASHLPQKIQNNIFYLQCPTNDTWARDHGFITLVSEQGCHLLDFKFNGWGEKFTADLDNKINIHLYESELLNGSYEKHLDFVLEGGSIESDGKGTIFTTSQCLLAPHRNQPLDKIKLEEVLKKNLCAERVLWIDHGSLIGDDTDGHIDTLVRVAPSNTLLYVGCDDKTDPQYDDLKAMEEQLTTFRTLDDKTYRLMKLPMPDAIYDNGERLPATYANFFVMNKTVLFPTYNQPYKDESARKTIQKAFHGYDVIGIDCRPLIKQHGSLHCCTMQYPAGCIK
jgi:agmatine deiminase